MAKPNYAFEKRQRELAKKRKKEEKASRKAQGRPDVPEGTETGEAGETAGVGAVESGDRPASVETSDDTASGRG